MTTHPETSTSSTVSAAASGSVGGSTQLRMYPASEVVVAIIANISGAGYRDLPEKIAELFMNQ